jgi:serine/threonine protein kinase
MSVSSWIGHSLGGRYKILELLGQGGMSAVYKVRDPNLRRVVAVKLIHSHLSDNPDFLRRFEEEAAAVAQLRHPNIVQVFDYNSDNGTFYMVLEFIPGMSLQDHLRRVIKAGRQLDLSQALSYAVQVCDAVDYAHKRGMIHRDIKPANIMIDIHNQAILMDFGIVKLVGGESHTASGAVLGTARYMSPEQIRGQVPDERSDVYSLGVTLFEMISGKPPFEADSVMTLLMMHLNDPVPDLSQLDLKIPPALVRIVNKSLSKTREGRYVSAAAMAADLRNVLSTLVPAPLETDAEGQLAEMDALQDALTQVDSDQEDPGTLLDPVEGINREAASSPHPSASTGPGQDTLVEPSTQSDSPEMTEPEGITQLAETPANEYSGIPAGTMSDPLKTVIEATIEKTYSYGEQITLAEKESLGAHQNLEPVLEYIGVEPNRRAGVPRSAFFAGGAALLVLILAVGGFASGIFGGGGERPTSTPTETHAVAAVVKDATGTPTNTPDVVPSATAVVLPPLNPTTTPTRAPTRTPTTTPTPTDTPTATVPPGPYVRINSIHLDGQVYVVEYETFEYIETLPGMHVHFFFDTVSQEQAGNPGSGPWKLYGGPRPFKDYTTAQRPQSATRMCALVANPDHSVKYNSGNCVELP